MSEAPPDLQADLLLEALARAQRALRDAEERYALLHEAFGCNKCHDFIECERHPDVLPLLRGLR